MEENCSRFNENILLLKNKQTTEYLGPCDGLIEGWYFMDEIGNPVGPYKSQWDTEKIYTMYLLSIEGIGHQALLYTNIDKVINNSMKKFKYGE